MYGKETRLTSFLYYAHLTALKVINVWIRENIKEQLRHIHDMYNVSSSGKTDLCFHSLTPVYLGTRVS